MEFLDQGFPVLSIDTKKKELLGNFHRGGPAWTDVDVRAWDHDFPSYSWGKVIPYGVYDLGRNEALMYLAQGFDTGELVVDAMALVVSARAAKLSCRLANSVAG